jgi:hypothetical protein
MLELDIPVRTATELINRKKRRKFLCQEDFPKSKYNEF